MSRFARFSLNACLALIALVLSGLSGLRAAGPEPGDGAPDRPAPATVDIAVSALPVDPFRPDSLLANLPAPAPAGLTTAWATVRALGPRVDDPVRPAPGCRRGAAGGPRAP